MKRIAILIVLLICKVNLSGQIIKQGELVFGSLLPLEQLIEMAINNAPSLGAYEISQRQTQEEISINKKKWLRHFSFTAGVYYGNGFTSDELTSNLGVDRSITYMTRQNLTYGVGLNLRLPMSELLSRKHEIKVQELEFDRLEYLKQNQSKFIREEVIRRYKELKGFFITMEINAGIVETNEIALKIAENFFKKGTLEMKEYRMAVDEHYTAKLEHEKAKNEAWYCIKSVSEIVGESIFK